MITALFTSDQHEVRKRRWSNLPAHAGQLAHVLEADFWAFGGAKRIRDSYVIGSVAHSGVC